MMEKSRTEIVPELKETSERKTEAELDPQPIARIDIEIVPGDGSKDRLFACVFDNFFITVIGLAAAMAVPSTVWLRAALLVAIYLGYFFLFEAIVGTTPGKLVLGLWVRRLEGGACSWQQAAVRTLARLIEVNPLLFGALPAAIVILTSTHRQRIGDLVAGTTVRKGRSV